MLRKNPTIRRALSKAKHWVSRSSQFPWTLKNEIGAVTQVLKSTQWNMGYGVGLVHEKLEREFADYVQVNEAIAVNTGGMALQIAMRALGIKPGDEVALPVDTCVANGFAILNAGASPILVDSDPVTLGINLRSLENWIGPQTKMVIPVHLWGNPENIQAIRRLTQTRSLSIIEDCCLALGATDGHRHVGHDSDAAVFSFGCVKPIQAGEGGMIVTQDKNLAREMRSIRNWGDRTREFSEPDVTQLSWNGRMSEIIAAVVLEQLRGFPALLKQVRENTLQFIEYLEKFPWIKAIHSPGQSSYNQLVLKLDLDQAGFTRAALSKALLDLGVGNEFANFEPMVQYSFFSTGTWKTWTPRNQHARLQSNYESEFRYAFELLHTGLGLPRNNFLGKDCVKSMVTRWEKALLVAEKDHSKKFKKTG